jgi:hypothetical protein
MDNPLRPRQDGKMDKGSPATASSGGARRIRSAIGAPTTTTSSPEARTLGLLFDNTRDYISWGLWASPAKFPADVMQLRRQKLLI